MMKKKYIIVLFIILLMPVITIQAREKTISEWESELASTQKQLDNNNAQKNLTQSEINAKKNNLNQLYAQIESANKEIDNKTQESAKLTEEIKEKNKEIKDLMRYYQESTSGSSMLEYVMGAESLTDLIYRLSITEQITSYNKKMIGQMNEKIKENDKVKAELANKKVELANLEKTYKSELTSLNQTKAHLEDDAVSLADSIKEMKNTLSYLRKLGCRNNETQTVCMNRIYSGSYLPSGTTFFRPTTTGRISSEYGNRLLNGSPDFHNGIDIAMGVGTPVYAVAPGRVVKAFYFSGFGNCVIINHLINNKKYTSLYAHLSSFNVSVGTVVTKDTVIARSGNTGNSFGPHLHLSIANGHYFSDYYQYNAFLNNTVNPRNVIVFPKYGGSFSNR